MPGFHVQNVQVKPLTMFVTDMSRFAGKSQSENQGCGLLGSYWIPKPCKMSVAFLRFQNSHLLCDSSKIMISRFQSFALLLSENCANLLK